jgi:hypothetical protein
VLEAEVSSSIMKQVPHRFDILLVKLWQLRNFELQGFYRHVGSPHRTRFHEDPAEVHL